MTVTLERPARPAVLARRPAVPRPPEPTRVVRYVPPPLPALPTARPEPRIPHRADVEGLRGLAVLLVVCYHAALPWAKGGFIGVDVFFVISGYIVTALLVSEVRQRSGVSLWAFYARRCRRILPAAGVVLVATCALGAALLPPLARLDLARDVLASALYGGNWHFIAVRTDYLRAGAGESPVPHLWSLGVQEQFSLLWPFVFVAALVLARRLRVARTTVLAVVLTALTAASFALSKHWTDTSAPLAHLSSPSRGWQLATGAWLALLLPVAARFVGRTARGLRLTLGLVGAAALGWAATGLRTDAYPGTAALLPALATAAVLAAGCDLPQCRATGVSRLLSSAPMCAVGRVSFTWYLWHWPLIAFVAARAGEVPWPVRLAVAVGSLGPAALTTRWVERPLRRSPVVTSRPRVGIALGVVATVVPVCAALVLGSVTVARLDGGGTRLESAGRVDRQVVRFDDTLTSGPVTPSAAAARRDVPMVPGHCMAVDGEASNPGCVLGRVSSVGPVVVFGDSHATQWYPAAADLAAQMGTGVRVLTKGGCPAADIKGLDAPGETSRVECDSWRESTFRRLETSPRPALVLVTSMSHTSKADFTAVQWARTLDRLVALGAPVVYVRDTPMPGWDVPSCVSGSTADWSRCAFPRRDALRPDATADAVAEGRLPGVHLVDLTSVLCPRTDPRATCPAVRGGVLLYRDHSHLTNTAARALTPQFLAAVRAQVLGLAEAGRR